VAVSFGGGVSGGVSGGSSDCGRGAGAGGGRGGCRGGPGGLTVRAADGTGYSSPRASCRSGRRRDRAGGQPMGQDRAGGDFTLTGAVASPWLPSHLNGGATTRGATIPLRAMQRGQVSSRREAAVSFARRPQRAQYRLGMVISKCRDQGTIPHRISSSQLDLLIPAGRGIAHAVIDHGGRGWPS
jgi:hypothetical protein